MGYSRNPITLERFRPHLTRVERGEADTWTVEEGQADYFAYKLREVLFIATFYPDKYPKIAEIAKSHKVVIVDRTTVSLVPTFSRPGKHTVTAYAKQEPDVPASPGLTAVDVVAAWQNSHESMQRLYFAGAKLPDEELLKLYKFLQSQPPAWHMLVDVDGALTIRPPDSMLVGLDWTPEDML